MGAHHEGHADAFDILRVDLNAADRADGNTPIPDRAARGQTGNRTGEVGVIDLFAMTELPAAQPEDKDEDSRNRREHTAADEHVIGAGFH